ncbi:MAG TPA: CDP-alcohol phosphatidyltransferase family protein [Nitrospiraceae bacterium]|nr:CDP-alcohol phosphatidyltransferase family protein [Nitrospiraceae bacterium]
MNESVIQQRAEIQGLATAILLPSVSVFGGPIGSQAGEAGPLTSVVGIGLFQRAVLTLQRAGIRQLIVLAGPEEDQLKQALGKGPRVTIPVRWMPIREFPLDDPRTWEALAAEVHGFALVASVNGIFSRGLIEQLRHDLRDGEAVVVAQTSQVRSAESASRGLRIKVRSNRLTAFAPARFDDSAPRAAELVVLPAGLMSAANPAATESGRLPIRQWLERAAVDGRVRVVAADEKGSVWYQDVRTLPDVQAAEKKLFSSLKGEFEGFVDRYFNRKLSRWFTRLFLAIGLSPNSITILATLVGLVSAAGFGMGSYTAGVVAAVLFQLAAVIDCCDGEVARLTFTESPFGAWLDIAMDNIVHMAIFAGIAAGLYVTQVGQDHAWVSLALGAAAVLGNGVSFLLVEKAQKIKTASGWKTPINAAWSDFMLKNVASRDFSVIVLIFALLGRLDWFLWMAAAGSLVFAGVMLWVIRPSAVSRA